MSTPFANRISHLKPSAIREILKLSSDPSIIPFSAGNPSAESFPVDDIRRFSNEILENDPAVALQYGITEGYAPLREQLRDFCALRYRAVGEEDDVIVTTGAQQVLDFVTKILVNEGDSIVCEGPTFVGALSAFKSYNANIAQVELTENGLDPDALEAAVKNNKNVRFIYVIPNFQNPTGLMMPLSTRKAVLDIAERNDVYVLEDNPYEELCFTGQLQPTIKSMDKSGRVIYAGSMSKILSPGLRIGFCSAPKDVIQKLTVAKQVSDVHTPLLNQMICSRFLAETDIEAHIEKIRAIYKHKTMLMLDCLDSAFGDRVAFTRPEGGLFIWCTLPARVDMLDFSMRAVKRGVAVVPGNAFYADDDAPCSSFRVNFSSPSDEQIVNGCAILGEVADEMMGEN